MAETIQLAVEPYLVWLRDLRWIDRTELILAVVGTTAAGAAAVTAGVSLGWLPGTAAGLGFLIMLAAVVVLTPRHVNMIPLGLITIAAFNLLLAVVTAWPNLVLICQVTGGLGAVCLPLTLWGLLKARRSFKAVASYTNRDDFRWLVTKAPLVLRLRMLSLLQVAAGQLPRS